MNSKTNIKNKLIDQASEPTLKRLPVYIHHLLELEKTGITYVSAPAMANILEFDSTQIVKDLSVTGIKGKPKVGYKVTELRQTIEDYLGFNKSNEAFLVGTGKLGQALLSYHELQGFGIKIIAAFDVDEDKVDTNYGNTPILHIDKIGALAERLNVAIGILTTPNNVAQNTAEAMVKSGIKAIWNLTPVKLKLPDNVIIQNTEMYANVAVLLKKFHHSESKASSD